MPPWCAPRVSWSWGTDRDGNERTVEGSGLLARAFQHEMDHLDGTLFVERLRGVKRDMISGRSKNAPRW